MKKKYFVLFYFLLFLFQYNPAFAQTKDSLDKKSNIERTSFCGSPDDPDSWKKDKYFGKNAELLDNLIKQKVKIDKDYLEKIQRDDNTVNATSSSMFAQSTPYLIPIKAWIYHDDFGNGNIDLTELHLIIDRLNNIFYPYTNIRFYLLCDITEINNSNYANNGDVYFDTYTSNNRTSGALNVHFVISSASWGGRARFPWDNPNYACAITDYNNPTAEANILAHEIGHTLGLFHTHSPGRTNNNKNEDCGDCYQESVSRTRTQGFFCFSTQGQRKCEVNGDFLCDTDADPALRWIGRNPEFYFDPNTCQYTWTGTDNWGVQWHPVVGNIMGYASPNCLYYFSPLQVSKMYGYIGGIGIIQPTFNISGPDNLCTGQTAVYSVTAIPGVTTYTWVVPYSMIIINGQGTNSITVQAQYDNGGQISVTPDCGFGTATFDVQNLAYINITGPDIACTNQYVNYEAPYFANTTYMWAITDGDIVSGQGTNTVTVVLYQTNSYSVLDVNIPSPCNPNQSIYGNIYIDHYPDNNCYNYRISQADSTKTKKSKIGLKADSLKLKANPKPLIVQKPYIKPFKNIINDIMVHPNPAANNVVITCPDNDLYDLRLINAVGETILRKNQVQRLININCQSYPSGIYLINLIGKNKFYSKKLIIKK